MKKQGLGFLQIDLAAVRELGANEAILLALIGMVGRRRKRDKDGFVGLETAYLAAQMGVNDKTIVRLRKRLVEAGKIDFRQGLNQNKKGLYRLTRGQHFRPDILSGRGKGRGG